MASAVQANRKDDSNRGKQKRISECTMCPNLREWARTAKDHNGFLSIQPRTCHESEGTLGTG